MCAAMRLLDYSNFKYPILCQALPCFFPAYHCSSRKHARSDSAPCQKFVYGASLWERVGEWLVWRYVERSQTVPCSYYLAAHMRISWNVLIISGTGRRWFWETVSSQFLYEGRLSNSAVASCNPSFSCVGHWHWFAIFMHSAITMSLHMDWSALKGLFSLESSQFARQNTSSILGSLYEMCCLLIQRHNSYYCCKRLECKSIWPVL